MDGTECVELASSEQATRHFAVLQFASSRISWINWNETEKLYIQYLHDCNLIAKHWKRSLLHVQNIGLKDEMRF